MTYKDHKKQLAYMRKWDAERRRKTRDECLLYYSKGKMECACCGENIKEFLAIDHINGGGNAHRRRLSTAYKTNMCKWLKMKGFPKGYQVLCYNCNNAKSLYGKCPHQKYNRSC